MNDIIVFENEEFGEVRTIFVDGKPWWVLSDLCRILDLSTPTRVAERLDEDEVSQTHTIDKLGRTQKSLTVNESGLYHVILRSDKPQAKPFRKWVTSEILPTIRKTGAYGSLSKEVTILSEEIDLLKEDLQNIKNIVLSLQGNNTKEAKHKSWSNWMSRMNPQFEALMSYYDVDRKELYKNLFVYFKRENTDIDLDYEIEDYCSKHCLGRVFTMEVIEHNHILRTRFQDMVAKLLHNIGIEVVSNNEKDYESTIFD